MSANEDPDPMTATERTSIYVKNVVVVPDADDTTAHRDPSKASVFRRLIPRDPYSINVRFQRDRSMVAGPDEGRGHLDNERFDNPDGTRDSILGDGRDRFEIRESIPFSPASPLIEETDTQNKHSAGNIQIGVRSVLSSPGDKATAEEILMSANHDGFRPALDRLQFQHEGQQQVVADVTKDLVLCNGTAGLFECPDPTSLATSGATTSSPDLLAKMGVGTILVLIFIISITINVMVLVMFCRRKVRLTVSSRFLLNLTVCNMLTAVFIVPFALTSLVLQDWVFGDFWCHVTGFILNLVIAASTLTLIVISLDRYCAIVTPLHYPMKMTRKRSLQLILAVWVIALVCALPPIFGWNQMEFQPRKMICTVQWTSRLAFDSYYNLFIVFLCFLVPLVALLWAYGVIFHAAKENSKRTFRRGSVHFSLTGQSATCAVLSNSTGLISTSISADASPALPSRRRSSSAPILGRRVSIQRLGNLLWYREERKTAVTCILIFMTFVACWSPYFAVIVIETFSQEDFELPSFVDTVSIVLAVSSCALDPLVYVLRNSQLRHEIWVMLRGEKINNTQLV